MEFNIVVTNKNLKDNEDLLPSLFSPDDEVERVDSSLSMIDLLVKCKLFQSKSDARRNWKRTGFDIPEGFTILEKIGKKNHALYIWNPF